MLGVAPFRKSLAFSLCLFICLNVACGEDDDQINPEDLGGELIESDVERADPVATDAMLEEYAFGQAEFAIRFLRAGFDADESGVFSSYSLAEALTIASTFDAFSEAELVAMQSSVGIDETQDAFDSSNTFRQAVDERIEAADPDEVGYANINDIWVEAADEADRFDLDEMQRYFGVGVRKTPLGSDTELGAETINKYIDYHTRGLIPNLISPGQLEDVFAAVSTVLYLKASWTGEFSEGSEREFFLGDDTSVEVPSMSGMTRTESNYDFMTGDFPDDEPTVVSIPLRGGFVFDIIAPPAGELPQYLADFDAQAYHELLDELSSADANVTMPVFEIDSRPAAKNIMLDEFGLPPSIFELGKIGDIIHEAVIDVNETGIEAAAATVITFHDNQASGPEFSVEIDRPFLYFVRDRNTRMVLFSGQYFGD